MYNTLIGGLVDEVLRPGDEPPAVGLVVLVGELVVGPAHVDEELGPGGRGVGRHALPALGARHVDDEAEDGGGGGEAARRREREVEGAEPAAQRALGQPDQRLAGELLVRADDLGAVELEARLVAALLRAQDVPEPVHRAVADEGVAAHPQRLQTVHGKLRRLQRGQVAAAQRDPPVMQSGQGCIYRYSVELGFVTLICKLFDQWGCFSRNTALLCLK